MVTKEQQIFRCKSNSDAWININAQAGEKCNADQINSTVPSINMALERVLELTTTSKPVMYHA